MHLTRTLDFVFDQATKVKVLRMMIATGAEMPVRKIAATVGVSHVQAGTALSALGREGVVACRRAGRSLLYRVEPENALVARLLLPLFEGERQLREGMRKEIARDLRGVAKAAYIYGSVAVGAKGAGSDVDLLSIPIDGSKREIEERLQRAAAKVRKVYGCELVPLVLTWQEVKTRYRHGDGLIVGIVERSEPVIGPPLSELIARSAR